MAVSNSKCPYIEPSRLRLLIAQAQIDGYVGDELAELLVRIHSTVIATKRQLRTFSLDDLEEAVSWSQYVWIKRGFKTIDLERWQNPFNYIYTGCYFNILLRLKRIAKKRQQHQEYVQKMLDDLKHETMSTLTDADD